MIKRLRENCKIEKEMSKIILKEMLYPEEITHFQLNLDVITEGDKEENKTSVKWMYGR